MKNKPVNSNNVLQITYTIHSSQYYYNQINVNIKLTCFSDFFLFPVRGDSLAILLIVNSYEKDCMNN